MKNPFSAIRLNFRLGGTFVLALVTVSFVAKWLGLQKFESTHGFQAATDELFNYKYWILQIIVFVAVSYFGRNKK